MSPATILDFLAFFAATVAAASLVSAGMHRGVDWIKGTRIAKLVPSSLKPSAIG